jgi:hypothetical protein
MGGLIESGLLDDLTKRIVQRAPKSLALKGSQGFNLLVLNRDVRANHRTTKDSDFYVDYVVIKREDVVDIVSSVLEEMGLLEHVTVQWRRRMHSNKQGMLEVLHRTYDVPEDELFFTMDFDPTKTELTETPDGKGALFRTVKFETWCMDKLDCMSKDKIMTRIKDVYDIYLASFYFTPRFYSILKEKTHHHFKLKESAPQEFFSFFKNEIAQLRAAYDGLDTLRYMDSKPSFDEVYDRAHHFAGPFMTDLVADGDAIWVPNLMEWELTNDKTPDSDHIKGLKSHVFTPKEN